jgi:hypothetical protein
MSAIGKGIALPQVRCRIHIFLEVQYSAKIKAHWIALGKLLQHLQQKVTVGVIETKINGYLMGLVIGCPALFCAPAAQIAQPLTGNQLGEARFD